MTKLYNRNLIISFSINIITVLFIHTIYCLIWIKSYSLGDNLSIISAYSYVLLNPIILFIINNHIKKYYLNYKIYFIIIIASIFLGSFMHLFFLSRVVNLFNDVDAAGFTFYLMLFGLIIQLIILAIIRGFYKD